MNLQVTKELSCLNTQKPECYYSMLLLLLISFASDDFIIDDLHIKTEKQVLKIFRIVMLTS